MQAIKKIALILITLIGLALIINFGLSYWVSKKLPQAIQSKKDFPYNFSYSDLDLNILSGSFTIHNAYLAPKDSMQNAMQEGAFAKIKTIEVNHFSVWAFLRNKSIKVSEVIITQPDVILYHRKTKYNPEDDFVKPFKNAISTGSLTIKNGSFKMLDSLQNPSLKASSINFSLTNIKVDSTTLKKDIPIRYRNYALSCDSLYYNAGVFYNITANKISTTDSTFTAENFRLIPKQTRVQFTRMQPKEIDQFNLQAGKINIEKLDWGYLRDTLYVHSPKISLNKVYANIYRSKEPKDDLSRKKLYSEMLRSLKFDLNIDKLLLKNTLIEYEEQLNFSKPAAKVSFSQFNATISNVYSPIRKKGKLPPTVMDVRCLFMKSAPLSVTWTFNIPDQSDAFTIIGHLKDIKAEEVNPITKPLMNATTEGDIKDVKFTFNGNRTHGSGTFAINYDDLTVDIYKKDGKKKNGLVSAVGNLLVKNDSDDRLKPTHVEVDRIPHKSVFNFLWRFNEQGLKQTVLPKFLAKKKDKKDDNKKDKKK